MATFFEPAWHQEAREARDAERYPELAFADADELLRIDRANIRDGEPLTSLGRAAIEVYARIGVSPEDRAEIEAQTREEIRSMAQRPLDELGAQRPLDELGPLEPSVGGGASEGGVASEGTLAGGALLGAVGG